MMQTDQAKGYVRVSTQKESQKDSPEHQQRAIKEHAASMGFQLESSDFYEDRDTATSIVTRDDVQRLIIDGKNGEYKTLFFSSLSRFSRDALDALSLKRILVNALGVRVISIEDNYDSGVEDNEMLFGIVSVINQKQSEQISTASKRGIRQSALKGNFTGSIAPYGYKKASMDGRKTLVVDRDLVNPEDTELKLTKEDVVKLIFDMYVNKSKGEKSITMYLNDEKIPSYKNGVWGITSVQRILQNQVYTGANVFSKHETKKVYNDLNNMSDREKKMFRKSSDLWETTDFKTHEAIISDELFEKSQEVRLIRGGGKRGGKKVYVNIFAKMIFCKHCGSAMVTMVSGRNNSYRYLMCSRRRRQGEQGCENGKWIPYNDFRDELIRLIIQQLAKYINNSEDNTAALAKKVGYSDKNYDKDIKKYTKQIEDNRKLLFELRREKMSGNMDESQYEFEKKEYEKEIQQFETKLFEAKKKSDQVQNIEKLKASMKEHVSILSSLDNYDYSDKTRITLSKLIQRIEVDKEGIAEVYTILLGRLE
jgi:site-specific DNA recombinase